MIPNAPYIVEAETVGIPPYSDRFTDETERQGKFLASAEDLFQRAIGLLLDAESAVFPFEEDRDEAVKLNNDIREMIYKVEGVECDVRQLAKRMTGRG